MDINPKTLQKYFEALQELLQAIENGEKISSVKLAKKYKMNSSFVNNVLKAGYIKKNGKQGKYRLVLQCKDAQPIHARRVIEEGREAFQPKPKVIINPLEKFKDEELIIELRKRGYSGPLKQIRNIQL